MSIREAVTRSVGSPDGWDPLGPEKVNTGRIFGGAPGDGGVASTGAEDWEGRDSSSCRGKTGLEMDQKSSRRDVGWSVNMRCSLSIHLDLEIVSHSLLLMLHIRSWLWYFLVLPTVIKSFLVPSQSQCIVLNRNSF